MQLDKKKATAGIRTRNKEIKLFVDDMIIY